MPSVIGVKFSSSSKVYYFDPDGKTYEENDVIVVDTARGAEIAEVAKANFDVSEGEITGELKKVLRSATEKDFQQMQKAQSLQEKAMRVADEKIKELELKLKFVTCEVSFDCKHVTFYFTAEGRVDFRELVKQLATALHARIELRQLYERDDVKKRGALGMCGRECCCRSHLKDFEKVTVKMAKVQGLSLNPTKISGICGKLMCCLKYENEYYSEVFKQMPKVNSKVMTPDGPAVVDSNDMLKKVVTCKVFVDDTYVMKKFPLSQVSGGKRQVEEADSADDERDSLQ